MEVGGTQMKRFICDMLNLDVTLSIWYIAYRLSSKLIDLDRTPVNERIKYMEWANEEHFSYTVMWSMVWVSTRLESSHSWHGTYILAILNKFALPASTPSQMVMILLYHLYIHWRNNLYPLEAVHTCENRSILMSVLYQVLQVSRALQNRCPMIYLTFIHTLHTLEAFEHLSHPPKVYLTAN